MDIPENSINEILENNPSQGTLHVLLTIMNEKGMHNIVIRECLRAVSRFPEDLALRKILAGAYLADGRIMEAEAEFCRVIEGIKTLADAYRSQAGIYARQKREDDAAKSLKKYLAIFPEDEETAILLEELMATSAVEAIELAEEKIDTDILELEESADIKAIEFEDPVDTEIVAPQEPETPDTMEVQEQEPPEIMDIQEPDAPEIMEVQEPEKPDIVEAPEPDEFPEIVTASLAETYFDQGKLDEAREIYEKLVEKNPEDASLTSRLDEISAMMEQKDEPEELKVEDTIRLKKERMISLLDTWRMNIKDLAREGLSE